MKTKIHDFVLEKETQWGTGTNVSILEVMEIV